MISPRRQFQFRAPRRAVDQEPAEVSRLPNMIDLRRRKHDTRVVTADGLRFPGSRHRNNF
jgi:hypothetical protein